MAYSVDIWSLPFIIPVIQVMGDMDNHPDYKQGDTEQAGEGFLDKWTHAISSLLVFAQDFVYFILCYRFRGSVFDDLTDIA